MLVHLIISGFVQGVGYRQFVKKTAQNLGLKGWVKNIDKGRVEALFYGKKELAEKAISACWQGPFLAKVKDIQIEWARLPAPKRSDSGQEDPYDKVHAFGFKTQAQEGKGFEIIK